MRRFFLAILVLTAAQFAPAQTRAQVQKAQVSIPFGSVTGTLVLAGDMLVFVDDSNPDASFAVSRADITDVHAEGEIIAVDVRQPIRDRTGERNKLSFRMTQAGAPSIIPDWWKLKPAAMAAASPAGLSTAANSGASGPGDMAATLTLPVRHDHRIGACTGSLVIAGDRINYESVSEVSHSHQWNMRDVKEIKHKNPYHLEIVGFGEDSYNFELQGRELDKDEFQKLVDRIAAARAKR